MVEGIGERNAGERNWTTCLRSSNKFSSPHFLSLAQIPIWNQIYQGMGKQTMKSIWNIKTQELQKQDLSLSYPNFIHFHIHATATSIGIDKSSMRNLRSDSNSIWKKSIETLIRFLHNGFKNTGDAHGACEINTWTEKKKKEETVTRESPTCRWRIGSHVDGTAKSRWSAAHYNLFDRLSPSPLLLFLYPTKGTWKSPTASPSRPRINSTSSDRWFRRLGIRTDTNSIRIRKRRGRSATNRGEQNSIKSNN